MPNGNVVTGCVLNEIGYKDGDWRKYAFQKFFWVRSVKWEYFNKNGSPGIIMCIMTVIKLMIRKRFYKLVVSEMIREERVLNDCNF